MPENTTPPPPPPPPPSSPLPPQSLPNNWEPPVQPPNPAQNYSPQGGMAPTAPSFEVPNQPPQGNLPGAQQPFAQGAPNIHPYAHPQGNGPYMPQPQFTAPTSLPPKKSRKKLYTIIAAVLVVLLALGGGVWWFFFTEKKLALPPAQAFDSPEEITANIRNIVDEKDYSQFLKLYAPSEKTFIDPFLATGDIVSDANSRNPRGRHENSDNALSLADIRQIITSVEYDTSRLKISDPQNMSGTIAIAKAKGTITPRVKNKEQLAQAFENIMDKEKARSTADEIEKQLEQNGPVPIGSKGRLDLVMVKEKEKWYFSPTMTLAFNSCQDRGNCSPNWNADWEGVAAHERRVEDAAQSAGRALLNAKSPDELLPYLSMTERRLIMVFGGLQSKRPSEKGRGPLADFIIEFGKSYKTRLGTAVPITKFWGPLYKGSSTYFGIRDGAFYLPIQSWSPGRHPDGRGDTSGSPKLQLKNYFREGRTLALTFVEENGYYYLSLSATFFDFLDSLRYEDFEKRFYEETKSSYDSLKSNIRTIEQYLGSRIGFYLRSLAGMSFTIAEELEDALY